MSEDNLEIDMFDVFCMLEALTLTRQAIITQLDGERKEERLTAIDKLIRLVEILVEGLDNNENEDIK